MNSLPALRCVALGLVGAGLLSVAARAAEPLTIQNEFLRVTWDAGSSSLAIAALPAGKTFASRIKLGGSGGRARAATIEDGKFGRGAESTLDYTDGNRDTVRLFGHLPFALFSATLHNGGREPAIVERLRSVSARLDIGRPTGEPAGAGHGRPDDARKEPRQLRLSGRGRSGDPRRRGRRVADRTIGAAAWSSRRWQGAGRASRPGSTTAGCGSSRARTPAAETFALGWFDDARLGLEAYAEAVAKVSTTSSCRRSRPAIAPGTPRSTAGPATRSTWPSWRPSPHGSLKPFGFEFVQIDDQWQAGVSKNGPQRNFTTHRPGGPYPGGMKATADKICGGWASRPASGSCPLPAPAYDPFFQDHPGLVRPGRPTASPSRPTGAAPAWT